MKFLKWVTLNQRKPLLITFFKKIQLTCKYFLWSYILVQKPWQVYQLTYKATIFKFNVSCEQVSLQIFQAQYLFLYLLIITLIALLWSSNSFIFHYRLAIPCISHTDVFTFLKAEIFKIFTKKLKRQIFSRPSAVCLSFTKNEISENEHKSFSHVI